MEQVEDRVVEACALSPRADAADLPDDVCAICLNAIPLEELAIVKGCEHQYCVTCILQWAHARELVTCPQCKAPFNYLYCHRQLDGSLSDAPLVESVCLLKRATWFVSFLQVRDKGKAVSADMAAGGEAPPEWYDYDEEDDAGVDEYDEVEAYYFSSAAGHARVVIGNRRGGENGFIRSGRMYARPAVNTPNNAARQQQQMAHKMRGNAGPSMGGGAGAGKAAAASAASSSAAGARKSYKLTVAAGGGAGSFSVATGPPACRAAQFNGSIGSLGDHADGGAAGGSGAGMPGGSGCSGVGVVAAAGRGGGIRVLSAGAAAKCAGSATSPACPYATTPSPGPESAAVAVSGGGGLCGPASSGTLEPGVSVGCQDDAVAAGSSSWAVACSVHTLGGLAVTAGEAASTRAPAGTTSGAAGVPEVQGKAKGSAEAKKGRRARRNARRAAADAYDEEDAYDHYYD